MHLAEEQVQRLLHGELSALAARGVRDHLEACSECRTRVGEAENEERWVLERLRALDHAQPSLQSSLVIQAAKSRGSPAWGRWAAGILLGFLVAGGAYAAPGSPLPGLLARVIHALVSPSEPAQPATQSEGVLDAPAGIAVRPGKRLTISFGSARPGDTAWVSLGDGQDVVVQARGGSTSFTSDPERLAIEHQGSPGRFEILIPRTASLVEVSVGGRRILLKEASRVSAEVTPDGRGRYLIPLISAP
jgi:Putative zinc-finger